MKIMIFCRITCQLVVSLFAWYRFKHLVLDNVMFYKPIGVSSKYTMYIYTPGYSSPKYTVKDYTLSRGKYINMLPKTD